MAVYATPYAWSGRSHFQIFLAAFSTSRSMHKNAQTYEMGFSTFTILFSLQFLLRALLIIILTFWRILTESNHEIQLHRTLNSSCSYKKQYRMAVFIFLAQTQEIFYSFLFCYVYVHPYQIVESIHVYRTCRMNKIFMLLLLT